MTRSHYSPSLGRFLSRDPIAEQGGRNLYAFVRNNPILEVESLGLAKLVLNVTKSLVKNYRSHIYGWTEGMWSTYHTPYLVCEKSKNGKYFLYKDKNERNSTLIVDVWYLKQGSTVIRQSKEYTITNHTEWLIYRHEMLRVNAYKDTVLKALHAGDVAYNKILGIGCNCEESMKDWFRQEKIFLRESNIEIERAKSRFETALANIGYYDRPL